MANTHISAFSRALLFERLVDRQPREPAEPHPLRRLTRRELRESVRREVGWLLSTRCPIPIHRLDERERSVIDYGVPDFSTFSPHSQEDHRRLAQLLSRSIAAFEPRLRHVRVTVERYLEERKSLLVRLDAVLVVESVTEPIAFPVMIQHETGVTTVHGSL